jgi:hypothetical protein
LRFRAPLRIGDDKNITGFIRKHFRQWNFNGCEEHKLGIRVYIGFL